MKIIDRLDKKYQFTFVVTCFLGFVTHLFMFTNLLPGNDETMFYFNLGGTRSFGRWGLYLLETKLPFLDVSINTCYGMPWVKGTISVILLALVTCCVVAILEINNRTLCILTGALIVTYPSVAATFSYMFTSSCYFFGLLLACTAVYITKRCMEINGWKKVVGLFAAALLLMFSLSIYQAYICFAIGLYVAELILGCLKSENDWRKMLKECFIYLAVILLGLIFYYISIQIMLAFFWPTLSDYQGIGELMNGGINGVIAVMLAGLKQAYRGFFDTPFQLQETIHFRRILWIFALIITCICMAVVIWKRKIYGNLKIVLIGVLLIMFPVATYSVYMMGSSSVSTLMLFGTVVPLLFCAGMIDKMEKSENIIGGVK